MNTDDKEHLIAMRDCTLDHMHSYYCLEAQHGIAVSMHGAFKTESYEEVSLLREDRAPRSGGADAQEELTGDSVVREGASNVTPIMLPVSARFPDVRQALVDALAEYDRGELVGVAIIKERQDSVAEAHSGSKMMLLAGCSRLAHMLNLTIDEE